MAAALFFFRVAAAWWLLARGKREKLSRVAGALGSPSLRVRVIFEHAAVPELARTGSRIGREFDTVAHVGVTRSSIEPVAFRLRSLLFIEQQKRTVSIDWVGGRSEEALGTTVNPNYEASVF